MDKSIQSKFQERAGLPEWTLVHIVNAIKQIPHGRPRERSAAGVVKDWRGTCSTKLLLLRELCPDLPIRFVNRVFRLTREAAAEHLGPEVATVISDEGVIDVHTYARILCNGRWTVIDLAFPGQSFDGVTDMQLPWKDGDDYEAGEDPVRHKEELVRKYGDPKARELLIQALSR